MFKHIRIHMLTFLVVKLPNTLENHFLSSDVERVERTILDKPKLMPGPVIKKKSNKITLQYRTTEGTYNLQEIENRSIIVSNQSPETWPEAGIRVFHQFLPQLASARGTNVTCNGVN